MQGSQVIGHDRSYMSHLANNVCACAVIIYCLHIDQHEEITWAEKSTTKVANNYHAEILGACSTQLNIKVGITGCSVVGHPELTVGCDNMGVV
jgi:hypothetical protein